MLQNNPLLAQLKQQLKQQTPRIEGVVKGTERGFGFLEAEGQTSYFIPPPYMKKVMHGDKIAAILHKERDRDIVEPETLLEPFLSRFVGRIQKKSGDRRLWVIPDHPLLKEAILARPATTIDSPLPPDEWQENDWVVAVMRTHPLQDGKYFSCEIVQFITATDDLFAPWWVTLSRYQLPREAPSLTEEPQLETADRTDFCALPFITIDSASTEDMDDALYIEELEAGKLKLWVAIADPTAYITADSELDKIAYQRQFTHYLPGFDIPMLPRQLSDNICSLQPNVRRPALVCTVTIEADGALSDEFHFYSAWVESKAKLEYDRVSDWLEQTGEWQPPAINPVPATAADTLSATTDIAEQLNLLHRFSQLRQQWRQQHSLLFRDRPDYGFVLDKQGKVLDIVIEQRRSANRMVEEAMIAANISAAKLLQTDPGYGIFNTHCGFEPTKLDSVIKILQEQGIEGYSAERLLTLAGFCELRRHIDTLPSSWLDSRLRRYQTLAAISTSPGPHFGLGVELYATWTSPIRKYGDMVNHRLLKAVIQHQPTSEPAQALGQLISEQRRLTRIAERDVSDWLYCRYLADKIDGISYEAEIMDISRGGMRVRLTGCGATAFMPASFIHAVRDELVCSQEMGAILVNGAEIYRLGDALTVQLHEVRQETRSIIAKLT